MLATVIGARNMRNVLNDVNMLIQTRQKHANPCQTPLTFLTATGKTCSCFHANKMLTHANNMPFYHKKILSQSQFKVHASIVIDDKILIYARKLGN